MMPHYPIQTETTLPTGNAHILEVKTDLETPEVHFTALPKGGPEAIWFHFRILPEASGATPKNIRCVLRFFENLLGNRPGDKVDGFHPIYRTDQQDWKRSEIVDRIEHPDGQISAAWEVPGNEGPVQVALCYPYAQAELAELLTAGGTYWTADPIGLTESGAPLQRLYNRGGVSGGNEPGIYCIARQHAAEAPGSWLLDGFLRHIAAHASETPIVWAVPFADADGVLAGRAGKDAFPWDFNRSWGSKLFPKESIPEYGSHPMRHEVKCIQYDLQRWKERCHPQIVLDFHAPVIRDASGIFCFLRDMKDGAPDAQHAPWVDAIERSLDSKFRAERFARSGRYPSRWNTARIGDFVNQALNLPMVTIETPYSNTPRLILGREDYRTAGRQIAEAVLSCIDAKAGIGTPTSPST